eukprot:TRINITY_DN5601_c0_g1_i1.p1 TRINITY_DN5601_c0_g1~~TRINITY_DN5601_c0_g1_i1.p1  ORF type:complete len:3007 (+),score=1087.89 TRINITY_DN5601_c0_g1_i1:67-9021(+)
MAGREPLRIGHKIALLFEEPEKTECGYVQATWSTGPQSSAPVGMLPLTNRDDTPENFEDCIFQILSGDGEVASGKDGKGYEELKFGQMVRLQHVAQGKTLCCSKKKSGSTDKGSKRVTLEPTHGGVKKSLTAKWRIAPRYQVRGEGEKVCDADQITLQPVLNTGAAFLSASSGKITGSLFREINVLPKDARDSYGTEREFGFTVKAYDTADLNQNTLRGGDCIMLYHKELRGYLVGTANDFAGGQPLVRLQQDGGDGMGLDDMVEKEKVQQMSNAMFIVEWNDPKQGGTMQAVSWHHREGVDDAKKFRLRLLGDGSNPFYLTLQQSREVEEEDANGNASEASGQRHLGGVRRSFNRSLRGRSGSRIGFNHDKLGNWQASLCANKHKGDDNGTLFQFLQTGDGSDTELTDSSRVVLWANQANGESGPTSVFMHVCNTPPKDCNEPGALAVGCSSRPLQKNGFELRKVPQDTFLALTSVLSQIPPIKQYTRELEKLEGTVDDRENGVINLSAMMVTLKLEPDRLIASLEEMIGRCYVSVPDGMDVLDLNGTGDKGQQKLLVDQMVPRLCFDLLRAQHRLPYTPDELYDPLKQFPQPETHRGSSTAWPPTSSLRIALLCYKLISASCRLNPELATSVARMINGAKGEDQGLLFMLESTVIYRKRDALRVMPVLIDLYRDNRTLQVETEASFVDRLMELVLEERWNTQFLKLLPHIVSTDEDIVESHQARVAEALFREDGPTKPPLMRMKLEGNVLKVCTPAEDSSFNEDPEAPIDMNIGIEEDRWETMEDFCNVSEDIKCKVISVDSNGLMRSSSRSVRSGSQSSVGVRADDLYEYFRLQIILFSRFCLGRGEGPKGRAQTVYKYIPERCLEAVILSVSYKHIIPDGLTSAFLMLAKTAMLDDFHDMHEKSVDIVKVLSRFDHQDLVLECHPKCVDLKKNCIEHLKNHTTHNVRYPTKIERTLTELSNLKLFLTCGFVTKDEFHDISVILTSMLDGTTDQYLPVIGQDDEAKDDPDNVRHRRRFSEEAKALLQLRVMVIEVMHIMLDFMNFSDVVRVLDVCKAYLDKMDKDKARMKDDDDDHGFKLPVMSALQTFNEKDNATIDEKSEENWIDLSEPVEQNMMMAGLGMVTGGLGAGLSLMKDGIGALGGLMGLTDDEIPFGHINKLYDVLLDLAQYHYPPLREAASGLLFRLMNRGEHIYQVCRNTQILSGELSVKFFEKTQRLAKNVKELLKANIVEEDATLDALAAELKLMIDAVHWDYDAEMRMEEQDILAKTNIHTLLLQEPIVTEYVPGLEDYEEADAYWNFVETFFKYLIALTVEHQSNQHLLLRHITTIARFLEVPGAYEDKIPCFALLQQCFYGNTRNCSVAPDSLLRAFMTTPINLAFLPFLFKLMKPLNRTLFRRQQAVYTNVMDVWDREVNFLGTTEGSAWTTPSRKRMRYVVELIKNKDYLSPNGRVAKHLSLVDFLKLTTEGKEMSLKRELRQDIWSDKFADPLDHLFSACFRKEVPHWYRAPYLELFREAVVADPTMMPLLIAFKIGSGSTAQFGIPALFDKCAEEIRSLVDWDLNAERDAAAQASAEQHQMASSSGSGGRGARVHIVMDQPKEDILAGVKLNSRSVLAHYIFTAVLPLFSSFLVKYFETESLDEDAEFDAALFESCSKVICALFSLADRQRENVPNTDVPGVIVGDVPEMVPVGYVALIAHIIQEQSRNGGAHHPAGQRQNDRLFSVKLRQQLVETFRQLRGLKERFNATPRDDDEDAVEACWPPELEVPDDLVDGAGHRLLSQRELAAEEAVEVKAGPLDGQTKQRRWTACFDMLKKEPFYQQSERFSALCLLVLRKGEVGKNFVKKTLIGDGALTGVIHADGALQIAALGCLAKFCKDYDPRQLLPNDGGDDLNIVYPEKHFFLPRLEREDDDGPGEEDPIKLDEDMSSAEKQAALENFGLCAPMLDLVSAIPLSAEGMDDTSIAILLLGCALLDGGNATVQDGIMREFTKSPDERFFYTVREQLRHMTETLKDLRRTLKKEVTRGKSEKEEEKEEKGMFGNLMGGVVGGLGAIGGGLVGGLKSVGGLMGIKKERVREKPSTEPTDFDSPDAHRVPVNIKEEALPDDCIETMRDRFNLEEMGLLLEFLRLMTEGHHQGMQNYFREQGDNHTSLDLVESVANFFQNMKFVTRVNADVFAAAVNALVEFVQGPCQANQSLLITLNIGETICKVLNDGNGAKVRKVDMMKCKDEDAKEQMWEIREAAALLLISLLEGSGSTARAKMLLANVDLEVLAEQMVVSYHAAGLEEEERQHFIIEFLKTAVGATMQVILQLIAPEGSGNELQDKLNLGCHLFIFFKAMLDAQITREREIGYACTVVWYDAKDRSVKSVLKKHDYRCYKHFNNIIATLEIARGDVVERVYFRKLRKSVANLREKSKETVINEVQRESGDGARVADFFDRCLALMHEIQYYEDMRKTAGLAFIHILSEPLEYVSLLSVCAINLYMLVLAKYTNDDTKSKVAPGKEHYALECMGITIVVLQCIHMAHFIVGPTRIFLSFKWREWELHQEDEALRENKENLSVHPVDRDHLGKDKLMFPMKFVITLRMMLTFWMFWERAAYLVGAFLGLFVSPLFYAVGPLEVVAFSPKLMNVVLAVTTHGKSLLLTLFLMCIVIYFFACWAFYRFPQYFDEEGDFGAAFNCDTLFKCWVLMIAYGLRQGGGMADIMMRPSWSDPSEVLFERIAFDLLYFLTLIILFLNIVFGIIIDTFAELRGIRAFIEEDQQSKCFICGLDRSVFDREAAAQGGFDQHYKHEHNMWTYLLFLHYVHEKPASDLSGQEKYVADMMAEKDASFFPIGKSLVLSASATEENNTEAQLENIIEKLPDKTLLEKVNAQVFEHGSRVNKLEQKLQRMVAMMEKNWGAMPKEELQTSPVQPMLSVVPPQVPPQSRPLPSQLEDKKPSTANPFARFGETSNSGMSNASDASPPASPVGGDSGGGEQA